jgi:hypothetical protein
MIEFIGKRVFGLGSSALSNLSFWVDAQINLCLANTYGCGYPKSKA